MKHLICQLFVVAGLTTGVSLNTFADSPPGQVDFGKLAAPGKGGEFVEIQVGSNLLSFAAQLVEKQETNAAKLLRSVQLIQINVVGLTDENRDELQKHVQQIRHDLSAKGWDRVVTVQQKNGEDVGVYTKTRGGETLEGLAVTVIDPKKEVVLVNLVGDIKPEQVAALGEKLNLETLKKVGAALKK